MNILAEIPTASERVMLPAPCAICGAEAVRHAFELPVLDGPYANEAYRRRPFFQCGCCGHTAAGLYDATRYDAYYRSLRDGYHEQHDTDESRYHLILQSLHKEGLKRALDWGCGAGGFLSALPASVEKFGVEISEQGAEQAGAKGTRVLTLAELQTLQFQGFFDLVTAIDVVEHVADLSALGDLFAKVLHPGGVLVLMTGDLHSKPARLLGRYWYYLHYGEHVSFFTEESLRIWLESNFQDIVVRRVTHHPIHAHEWVRSILSFGLKWTLAMAGLAERFRWCPKFLATSDHLLVTARRRAKTARNDAT